MLRLALLVTLPLACISGSAPNARAAPPWRSRRALRARISRLSRRLRVRVRRFGRRGSHAAEAPAALLRQHGGDLSTASLLAAGAAKAAKAAPMARSLTGVGSVALGLHSGYRLVKARTRSQRAEAAHGIAWGLQGLAGLGKALAPSGGLEVAAKRLGLAGAAIQVGLGAHRLVEGVKKRDRESLIHGTLDVGAGVCWAATACGANPAAAAGFAGLTVAHIAYENRHSLRRAIRRVLQRANARERASRAKGRRRRRPSPAPR
ncbi:MAG: hypothetical protein KC503_24160 [Myxococcales bacterium]|nr:hypothetical protein [Myxococcales bacterium]